MDEYTSHELAYKKGYEQGKQYALRELPENGYLCGYRVTELALIAELLQRNLVSEDDLHNLFGNFSRMYKIIISMHQMDIKKAMTESRKGVGALKRHLKRLLVQR